MSDQNQENIAKDPVIAAAEIVQELFPNCRAAFLSSGVLSSRRTPTSDLDIVIVLDGPPAPYRETVRALGWVVELFVHSRESLEHFYEIDARDRRCTLARMCSGYVIKDFDGVAEEIQRQANTVISAGPAELTPEEREQRRYFLTDLLDDLRGTSDPIETVFIAGHLLQTAGMLVLQSGRHWTGSGKWLARQLEEVDGEFDSRLAEGLRVLVSTGDKNPLIEVVTEILGRAGGPLTEGYGARAALADVDSKDGAEGVNHLNNGPRL